MAERPDLIREGLLSLSEKADDAAPDAWVGVLALRELLPLLLGMHARIQDLEEPIAAAESAHMHEDAPRNGGRIEPPPVHTYAGAGWLINELAKLVLIWDTDTGYSIGGHELEHLAQLRRYALRWVNDAADAGAELLPPRLIPNE